MSEFTYMRAADVESIPASPKPGTQVLIRETNTLVEWNGSEWVETKGGTP
jgi:hypothetical protein